MDILFHFFGASTFNVVGAFIFDFGCWLWIKPIVAGTTKLAGVALGAGGKFSQIIDPSKKFRQNRFKKNMEGVHDGSRFKGTGKVSTFANDTLRSASVFAGSERKLDLLTQEGRDAAYTQRQSEDAAKHASSDRAKATQHNDSMHRALTFKNEADARANYQQRFAYKDENGQVVMPKDSEVESGIKAARANGGWSSARQVYAAKQLIATGTGYNNIEQAYRTTAAVAGNNEGLQADIAGAFKLNPARVDMNASFGTHLKMVQKALNKTMTEADVDKAVVEALESTDAVTLARGKPTAVKNVAGAATREIKRVGAESNNAALEPQLREAAQKRVGQLVGMTEQIEQATGYAAPINVQHISDSLIIPTKKTRDKVVKQAPTEVKVYRTPLPTAANPNPTPILVVEPNDDYNANIAAGYNQQSPEARAAGRMRPWQPGDPNDPRNN